MYDVLYGNVILTDVDGVLVYWEHSFAIWMQQSGYGEPKTGAYELHDKYDITPVEANLLTTAFNESAWLTRLPPMRDAIKYVKKLHDEHGYVFHCITAIPDFEASRDARRENLRNLFGPTAFEKIILCGNSKNKDGILEQYQDSDCFWLEDLPKNCEMGLKHGLKPILMSHHYNTDYAHPLIPRVNTWKDIYGYVVGDMIHPA